MQVPKVSVGLALVAGGLLINGYVVTPVCAGISFPVVIKAPSVEVTVPAAPVVVALPAPVVVAAPEVAVAPETYIWDGFEFVGEVGGVQVFLGPEGGWHHFDAVRRDRFHGWEHSHADWRNHAIHNDKYRKVVVAAPAVAVTMPAVAVTAPAIAATTPVIEVVPETYVWDGFEFVGEVGGVQVFLGPEGGWHHFEAARQERFHGWEHDHADWRNHAVHNDKFRGHGKEAPRHDDHH